MNLQKIVTTPKNAVVIPINLFIDSFSSEYNIEENIAVNDGFAAIIIDASLEDVNLKPDKYMKL